MLLRYSQNVARGHGIVWNVGEHPVEGATDFLFMISIAGISWLTKASVNTAAAALLFVSQILSVFVMYAGLRRIYSAPRLVAAGLAVLLGTGLGFRFINTGFSPPFYSLFALLTWYVGLLCIQRGVTWQRAIWFSIFALVTGLIRPDGVFLSIFMLCSTLYGVRAMRAPLVVSFGTIYALIGGAYFLWRVHYFGYPMPNPFYIKRASGIEGVLLKLSMRTAVEMLLPILPLAGLGLSSRAGRRQLIVWLITVVPFLSIWMFMSLDNDHFSRFQYVVVPLSLMSLGGIVTIWWKNLQQENPAAATNIQTPAASALVLLFCFTIYYNMHLYRAPYSNLGAQQLAERLKPYAGKNYTMAVTEAGDLPLYSEWKTIDVIGLNDSYIAHHQGIITNEYLDRYKPEVILYREIADSTKEADDQKKAIGKVLTTNKVALTGLTLRDYAVAHGYVLAAKWGATYADYHVYYVRPDFPDSDAIVSAIRDHPYYMQSSGLLSYDFRDAPYPMVPSSIAVY